MIIRRGSLSRLGLGVRVSLHPTCLHCFERQETGMASYFESSAGTVPCNLKGYGIEENSRVCIHTSVKIHTTRTSEKAPL